MDELHSILPLVFSKGFYSLLYENVCVCVAALSEV